MPTDEDFLRKLLDNPADDTARLVYADWLDEQGDETSLAKAKFLRLTAKPTAPARKSKRRRALQKLAAGLDTDWLAVVSKLDVENCAGKKRAPLPTTGGMRIGFLGFEVLCDKRWNELTPPRTRRSDSVTGARNRSTTAIRSWSPDSMLGRDIASPSTRGSSGGNGTSDRS
jgi:uncharacterized protein (TIGR02996 family)